MSKEKLLADINRSLSYFHEDTTKDLRNSQKRYMQSLFVDLMIYMTENKNRIKSVGTLYLILNNINNIMLLMFTVLEMDGKRKEDTTTDRVYWESIMGLSIKYFHFELRCLMDNVAKFVHANSEKKTPEISYNKLLNGLKKGKYKEGIPGGLEDLIVASEDWFVFIKSVRDKFIHYDGGITVFPRQSDTHEIIFSLHENGYETIFKGKFIAEYKDLFEYNKNDVMYFRYYMAIIMCNVFNLLEDVSKIYLAGKKPSGNGKAYNDNFAIYIDSSNALISKISG